MAREVFPERSLAERLGGADETSAHVGEGGARNRPLDDGAADGKLEPGQMGAHGIDRHFPAPGRRTEAAGLVHLDEEMNIRPVDVAVTAGLRVQRANRGVRFLTRFKEGYFY